jgi:hypothetical protein
MGRVDREVHDALHGAKVEARLEQTLEIELVRPSRLLEQPVLQEASLRVQLDERVAHLKRPVEAAPVEQAHQVGQELVKQAGEAGGDYER